MEIVYRLADEIEKWLPSLGKWQRTGLAMYSWAVVEGQHCQQEKIAEELGAFGDLTVMKKRLQRWLKNDRIDVAHLSGDWVQWVLSHCQMDCATLLVDETKLSDRLGVMMVSLAYQNRAIPLVWRCYKANSEADYPAEGQVALIVQLLKQVVAHLPAQMEHIVLADRGIGHSSKLMQALSQAQIKYLLRIKWDARFTIGETVSMILKTVAQVDTPWQARGKLFTRDRAQDLAVHLWWDAGCVQPWCLATNVETISSLTYAKRVWQEESFRDLKSGGWQWHQSYIRHPERASRLILILALAYAWMLSLGTQVTQTLKKSDKFSIFRRGLRHFKFLSKQQLFWAIPVRFCFRPLLS